MGEMWIRDFESGGSLSPNFFKECQTRLQEMSDSMHCQMFYMIKSVMEADF